MAMATIYLASCCPTPFRFYCSYSKHCGYPGREDCFDRESGAQARRNPGNPHDCNALGIYVDGDQVGNAPRADAALLSPLIDAGEITLGEGERCDAVYRLGCGLCAYEFPVVISSSVTEERCKAIMLQLMRVGETDMDVWGCSGELYKIRLRPFYIQTTTKGWHTNVIYLLFHSMVCRFMSFLC